MKIKNITDIITNSSSEVFVIRYKKDEKRKDIIKLLINIFESLGLNIDDYLTWKTESKDKGEDPINGWKTKKGDLIILPSINENGSYKENSIPLAICAMLKNIKTLDPSIAEIRCWFSGIGSL